MVIISINDNIFTDRVLLHYQNSRNMGVTEITDKEFMDEIQNNPSVIIKYYADWCGNCKLIAPKYKRLSNDERFSGVKFLDVNAENNPVARDFVKVDNLPFFAVIHNGQIVEASAGSKEEMIVNMLDKVMAS